jgi:hypothetical protein
VDTETAKDGDGMTEAQIIKRPDSKWDVVLKGFEESGAVRPDANLFVFDGKGGKLYYGAVYQFLRGDVKLEDLTEV